MKRSRHHVVSRGLQRFFADGERVTLVDKVQRHGQPRIRPAGTAHVFRRKNLSSYLDGETYVDTLEDHWCEIENTALPPIRSWLAGRPFASAPHTLGSRDATKLIAALHFARSYAYRDTHEALFEEQTERAIADFSHDPEFHRLWLKQYGSAPSSAEIAAVVNESAPAAVGTNSVFAVNQMGHFFNKALGHFEPLHVQAVMPRTDGVQFVLGDSPFVLAKSDGSAIGARELALLSADRLFLPLGPRLAVFLTSTHFDDVFVADHVVQDLNRNSWNAAGSQVIAHPSADLDRSLARTGWKAKVGRNQVCPCGSGRKSKHCCESPAG